MVLGLQMDVQILRHWSTLRYFVGRNVDSPGHLQKSPFLTILSRPGLVLETVCQSGGYTYL